MKIRLTDKEIEERASEYAENVSPSNVRGDFDRYAIAQAFEDGVKFAFSADTESTEKQVCLMKPFDLEAARQFKPVCTRDGRPVRILCFDRLYEDLPILALVRGFEDEEPVDTAIAYRIDGTCGLGPMNRNLDLMMCMVKRSGWVNIYRRDDGSFTSCGFFNTDDEAKKGIIRPMGTCVATELIEWEE